MVSLFSAFVARGVQVPAIDPRIEGHTSNALAVDLIDERPATSAQQVTETEASGGVQTSSESVAASK